MLNVWMYLLLLLLSHTPHRSLGFFLFFHFSQWLHPSYHFYISHPLTPIIFPQPPPPPILSMMVMTTIAAYQATKEGTGNHQPFTLLSSLEETAQWKLNTWIHQPYPTITATWEHYGAENGHSVQAPCLQRNQRYKRRQNICCCGRNMRRIINKAFQHRLQVGYQEHPHDEDMFSNINI